MLHPLQTSQDRTSEGGGWSLRRLRTVSDRERPAATRPAFEPPADVYETPAEVVVRLEIAGLRSDQLNVVLSWDGAALTVAGHRPDPTAGSPRKYYSMEIQCGEFSRRLALPVPVKAEGASAVYMDGFLQITLPKDAGPRPRARNVPVA